MNLKPDGSVTWVGCICVVGGLGARVETALQIDFSGVGQAELYLQFWLAQKDTGVGYARLQSSHRGNVRYL